MRYVRIGREVQLDDILGNVSSHFINR